MSDMVTLTLAHPLTAAQAARLRAVDVQEYPRPGMKVTVPRDEARAIIDAGYASDVEPGDQEAVQAALAPTTAPAKSSKAST